MGRFDDPLAEEKGKILFDQAGRVFGSMSI